MIQEGTDMQQAAIITMTPATALRAQRRRREERIEGAVACLICAIVLMAAVGTGLVMYFEIARP